MSIYDGLSVMLASIILLLGFMLLLLLEIVFANFVEAMLVLFNITLCTICLGKCEVYR